MKKDSKLITLRIDVNTLKEWDEFCKIQGLRRSDLIRTAVNNFITSSTPERMEIIIDKLLLNYSRNLRQNLKNDMSFALIEEIDKLKLFLQDKMKILFTE
jgi:hypothetical protein